MRKIRIHNDISIDWAILTDGEAISLEERTLALTMYDRRGKTYKPAISVASNVVSFAFKGTEQLHLGPYLLKLQDTTDGVCRTIDMVNAFELVPHTFMAGDTDESNVETEVVELTSTLDTDGKGLYATKVYVDEQTALKQDKFVQITDKTLSECEEESETGVACNYTAPVLVDMYVNGKILTAFGTALTVGRIAYNYLTRGVVGVYFYVDGYQVYVDSMGQLFLSSLTPDTYTKTEIDTALNKKANQSDVDSLTSALVELVCNVTFQLKNGLRQTSGYTECKTDGELTLNEWATSPYNTMFTYDSSATLNWELDDGTSVSGDTIITEGSKYKYITIEGDQ